MGLFVVMVGEIVPMEELDVSAEVEELEELPDIDVEDEFEG